MWDKFLDLLVDVLVDTAKVAPILYLVYLLLEWAQTRWRLDRLATARSPFLGPLVGALAGLVPQCGVSAVATFFYLEKYLGIGTLIAVYLSTSDEAVPLLMAHPDRWPALVGLLAVKFISATLFGCLFALLLDRKRVLRVAKSAAPSLDNTTSADTQASANGIAQTHEQTKPEAIAGDNLQPDEPEDLPPATAACDCGCCNTPNPFLAALWHTLKISLFVIISLLAVQTVVLLVGEDAFRGFLEKGGWASPILAALVGLIPGCGTSVLITEVYLTGGISFGSCVAGLSSGAGFGLLLLIRSELQWKQKLLPVVLLFSSAAVIGLVTDLLAGALHLPV